MIEQNMLEKEIALFHENVQNSNLLMKNLQEALDALRTQTESTQKSLAKNDRTAVQIPKQVEERLQALRTQFNTELAGTLKTNKTALQNDTKKTVQALKQYNEDAKAAHDEMLKLSESLAEIEHRWTDMTKKQMQVSLVTSTADFHRQFSAFTDHLETVLQTLRQTEQERLIAVLQAQKEQNTAAQQHFQAAAAQVQASNETLLHMMQNMEQNQQSLSSEFQAVKRDMQGLKDEFSSLTAHNKDIQTDFKKHFRILLIVLIVILLCVIGSFVLNALRGPKNTENVQNLGALPIGEDVQTNLRLPKNYIGQLKRNAPDGSGTYTWKDSATYEGNWSDGVISGEGVFSSAKYQLQGAFENNQLQNGTDTVHTKQADVIFQVKNGQADESKVKVIFQDSTEYEGDWDHGITGTGTVQFKNGDSYTGKLLNGSFQGKGTYTWKNGASYDGEWDQNRMHGSGTYYYEPNKNRYIKGSFQENLPVGEMKYYFQSHTYTTTWQEGCCVNIQY